MKAKSLLNSWRFLRQYYFGNKPHLAYVSGWNGHQNLGDEALYAAMQQYFAPFSLVDYPKGCWSWSFKVLPEIKNAVLAGGTMIAGKRSNAMHTRRCFELCRHTVVFGTGVNHPDFWRQRLGAQEWDEAVAIWKQILQQCPYIGVRGPDSLRILQDWGIQNAEVIGDPVLYFAMDRQAASLDSAPRGGIGLNVAETKGRMYGDGDHYLQAYIDLVRMLKQAGWEIYWYVLWPRDYPLTKYIAEQTQTTLHIHSFYVNHTEFMHHVKQHVCVFVGMRLHGTALATLAYIPSISIAYQPKCYDYMKSISQQDAVVSTDTFQPGYVRELIESMHAKRSSVIQTLYDNIHQLRQKQIQRSQSIIKEMMLSCEKKS